MKAILSSKSSQLDYASMQQPIHEQSREVLPDNPNDLTADNSQIGDPDQV
jgi:hypothetical protein